MEIKYFSDFEPFNNAGKIFNVSLTVLCVIEVLALSYYVIRIPGIEWGAVPVPEWVMHTLFIVGLILIIPVLAFGHYISKTENRDYTKWLSAKNKQELILIAYSPEFRDRENQAARRLLDKNFPGWSLEQFPPKHYVEDV